MRSLIELFLAKINRMPFATIDFQHWLNRKGLNLSDNYAEKILLDSNLVTKLPDGRLEPRS